MNQVLLRGAGDFVQFSFFKTPNSLKYGCDFQESCVAVFSIQKREDKAGCRSEGCTVIFIPCFGENESVFVVRKMVSRIGFEETCPNAFHFRYGGRDALFAR